MNKKRDFEIKWSECVNNPENKPYKDEYGTKQQPIWAIDYVVYNIIRNKPLDHGFKIGSKRFEYAVRYIDSYLKYDAKNLLNKFGDTVNVDEFRERGDEALRLHRNS